MVFERDEPARWRQLLNIKARFYRSFDLSRARALMRTRIGQRDRYFVGEGTFFENHLFAQEADLPLVISIAKAGFGNNLEGNIARWQEAIRKVNRLRTALVPPIEVIRDGNSVAYVTPHFPDHVNTALIEWQPLAELEAEFHQGLRGIGLVYTDVLQIRCLEGIPFNVDWSDVEALSF